MRQTTRRRWCGIVAAVFAAALAIEAAQVAGAPPSVVAPGAALRKVAGGFAFTEGPTSDKAGNVYFTDQPNNRILKWSVDGALSTLRDPAGRANGMIVDAEGHLLACADERNELWRIAPDGGAPFNGPNDVWIQPDGTIYVTDPFYKRPWWTHDSPPQGTQQVYRLSPDGATVTRVTDDLVKPNGIIGTPDGRTLYVADIGAGKTYAYDIQPDGLLAKRRLFCESGSDGMTLDEEGHVYLTGKGVLVFDRNGRHVETIAVPEPWTANVAFGGRDRRTLFITASTGLYAIDLRVRGANATK